LGINIKKGIYDFFYKKELKYRHNLGIEFQGMHYIIPKLFYNQFVIVDAGANKGGFYTSMLLYQPSEVIAIEADPDLCASLPIPSVPFKKYNRALAYGLENISFFRSLNSEANSIFQQLAQKWETKDQISVQTITIESVIKDIIADREVLLKLDIEGAESSVLLNMSAESWKRIFMICVEFHDFLGITTQEDIQNVKRRAHEHGFVFLQLSMSDYHAVLLVREKDLATQVGKEHYPWVKNIRKINLKCLKALHVLDKWMKQ
jgi:FkbM family methyltransferase